MKIRNACIYALVDIKTRIPFYVGSTDNPHNRLCTHKNYAKNSTYDVYRHIRENNIEMDMEILEEFRYRKASVKRSKEQKWMLSMIKKGIVIKNYYVPGTNKKYENHRKNNKSLIFYNSRDLSRKVREKRLIEEGISVKSLAEKLEISAATICRVENGSIPDVVTYATLCKWLKLPLDKFIKDKR